MAGIPFLRLELFLKQPFSYASPDVRKIFFSALLTKYISGDIIVYIVVIQL